MRVVFIVDFGWGGAQNVDVLRNFFFGTLVYALWFILRRDFAPSFKFLIIIIATSNDNDNNSRKNLIFCSFYKS